MSNTEIYVVVCVLLLLAAGIIFLSSLYMGERDERESLERQLEEERSLNSLRSDTIGAYARKIQTLQALNETLEGKRDKMNKEQWSKDYFVGRKDSPNELFVITRRDTRQAYQAEFESLEAAESVAVRLAQNEPGVTFVILAPTRVIQSNIPVTVTEFEPK